MRCLWEKPLCANSSVSSIYSPLPLSSALRSSYLPRGTRSQTPCQLPYSHELLFQSRHHRALTFPSTLSPSLAYKHLGDSIFLPIPRWFSGKESACQCRRHRFDPWVRKIRKWQPTPAFLPGKSHGQRSLVNYSSCVRKESDMPEHRCGSGC